MGASPCDRLQIEGGIPLAGPGVPSGARTRPAPAVTRYRLAVIGGVVLTVSAVWPVAPCG